MVSDGEAVLRHVLVGITRHRVPGWSFTGNFLQLSFDEATAEQSTVSVDPEPFLLREDGQFSLGVLTALADVGLAAVVRGPSGEGRRQATVSLGIQFTGAPLTGRLMATSRLDGQVAGAVKRVSLARGEIAGDSGVVATTWGSFIDVAQPGLVPVPQRRRGDEGKFPPADEQSLDPKEREIVSRARAALATGGVPGFVDRFWGLHATPLDSGARTRFSNGPHVGNRVGHTQGGISAALAATSAITAIGADWGLSALMASYVGPGIGPTLEVQSTVVHRGGSTGVVHTSVRTVDGRGVLDCVTQHHKLASS